jgi:hypothetical protein
LTSTALDSPARDAARPAPTSILERPLDLGAVTWGTLVWAAALAVAYALRFADLDVSALAADEARRAYDAWSLAIGRPSDPGRALPETSPLFLLLQAFGFFLFGATDAVARLAPACRGSAPPNAGVSSPAPPAAPSSPPGRARSPSSSPSPAGRPWPPSSTATAPSPAASAPWRRPPAPCSARWPP